jgi:hypothetical protein
VFPNVLQSSRAPADGRIRRRHWPVIALELLVAAAAVYGGVGLVRDNAIGMPAGWLDGSPFTSWVLPGALLLAVVAVPMVAAAVLELLRAPAAAVASVLAGAVQIAWIAAQLAIMQRYDVLQPVTIGVGLAVLLLALWPRRRQLRAGERG